MRKILGATAIAILLSSCGTKTIVVERTPDTTEYVAPKTSPAPQKESPESAFLNGLTATHPYEVTMLGKQKALEMGKLTCGAIDEGSTLEDFALMAMRNNVDAGFIGALIREAVHNFCPDNQWFIDSALNA